MTLLQFSSGRYKWQATTMRRKIPDLYTYLKNIFHNEWWVHKINSWSPANTTKKKKPFPFFFFYWCFEIGGLHPLQPIIASLFDKQSWQKWLAPDFLQIAANVSFQRTIEFTVLETDKPLVQMTHRNFTFFFFFSFCLL